MAKIIRTSLEEKLTVTLVLDEAEVRALDGIFGYNVEHFLKVFYERMGKAYVQPHEAGVRSLHQTIRSSVAGPLAELDKARAAIRAAFQKQP